MWRSLPSRPSSNPSDVAYNRLPPGVLGTRRAPLAAIPEITPVVAATEIAQAVARQAPRALPRPQPSSVSESSASTRVNVINELLSQPVPDKLNFSVLSQYAQRLAAARFELAGFNADGISTQTDLRLMRQRHDSTVTQSVRARLLKTQFVLSQQSSALLGKVLPMGVPPGHGVTQLLVLESLPRKTQAQLLLACMPSHLLNDNQLRAWKLPSVRHLIAIAKGPEILSTSKPWPWKVIHARLLEAQGYELLVGKSRYRNVVPGLDSSYGRSTEGSEASYTFGTRLQRLWRWLFHRVSSELTVSRSSEVQPAEVPQSHEVSLTESPQFSGAPLTEANLKAHLKAHTERLAHQPAPDLFPAYLEDH